MHIEITVIDHPELAGEVRLDGGAGQPFAGWLQLLSILADALPAPE